PECFSTFSPPRGPTSLWLNLSARVAGPSDSVFLTQLFLLLLPVRQDDSFSVQRLSVRRNASARSEAVACHNGKTSLEVSKRLLPISSLSLSFVRQVSSASCM